MTLFWVKDPQISNPKRERGNYRKILLRLRFGLPCDAKVALSN